MRIVKYVLAALVIAIFFPRLSYAATPDRISGALDIGPTVTLHGNAPRAAQARYDQGPVDPALRLGYMTLLTMPSVGQQKALKELVAQQQDPRSPNYHKWLTPEQWAARFGLSRGDVQKITKWLRSEGFRVGNVARGRNWISFSGTAVQVQRAFGTEIHRFNVNGEMHVGNAEAPRIPAALAGIVAGLRGLDDFHVKTKVGQTRPYYYEGNLGQHDFLAPGDIATMYSIDAFYGASPAIDGTGEKLVIVGQTDIFLTDINDFRAAFGLTPISGCTSDSTTGLLTGCSAGTSNFQYVLVPNAPDPGTPSLSDLSEADLDLEWSGAVARNAKIIYVNAPVVFGSENLVSGGIWDAWYYAVDQNLAPVISMSYGKCEWKFPWDVSTTDEIELLKANSEGITFLNASGDSGAAECDPNDTDPKGASATGGWAVSYPASSPEVTGVGGTAIPVANYSSQYWGTSNSPDGGSALSYIPEQAQNDDAEFAQWCTLGSPTFQFCSQGGNPPVAGWIPITSEQTAQEDLGILSSGGGASNCAVQNPTFTACISGFPQPSWQTVTVPNQASARFSPDISLAASANSPGYIFCTPQEAWGGNGTSSTCVNGISGSSGALELYHSHIGGTSAATPVFAGMVTLLNQYLAGPSSPGLGNINPTLYQLAAVAPAPFHPVTTGDNYVFCQPGTGEPGAPACPSNGTAVLGFSASNADATTGYNLVTGLGSVNAFMLAQAWAATLPFTLSASPTSLTAVAGQNSNTSTITITPQNGFSGAVTLACSAGLPTGATCNFTTVNSTSSTLVIQTAANMARVSNVPITVKGTSGGVSNITTVSLTVTPTTENFSLTSNLGTNGTLVVTQGTSGSVSLTVNSSTGFVGTNGGHSSTSLPLTYSCSGLPSGSSCNFSPSNPSSQTSITLSIGTAPPTARLLKPVDRGLRLFYAVLLPGLVGIAFTFGSRKRSLGGMRMLGLIMVLGLSTLGLGSCGGYGITSLDPGKPNETYSITVNATTGGANPVSAQTVFTLQVN